MKRVLAILLLWSSSAFAQPPVAVPAHGPMMTIEAEPTRIKIGPEFVPTCDPTDVMNKVVAVGEVWVPGATSIWGCIYNKGKIQVDRTRDTVLRYQTIVNDPATGVIEIGTVANPIPADRKVELIVRDVPINTTDSTRWDYDPYQWGNGLVNFGTQTRVGAVKTPRVIIAGVQAGATTLQLQAPVVGWRVGDELLIPDTQQSETNTTRPRREATVTIAAISGLTLTLSKPLDFAHLEQLAPDGLVVLKPIVANLTRNIVLRSENVAGTPGHSANIGDAARWDITANQFVGLGRTSTDVINNTTIGGSGDHIGTNQIGKYASHNHHAGHSSLGSQDVNNVYIAGRGKWGHSQHGTHDMLFKDNNCVGFTGACYVTEDGYETRNKFYNNLGAYSIPEQLDFPAPDANVLRGCPGCEGTGGWFRGIQNDFQGNQFWNNVIGMNLFAQNQVKGSYPSTPGGPIDTPLHPRDQPSVAIKGNGVFANMNVGFDDWGVQSPVEDLTAVNNTSISILISQSTTTSIPVFKNPVLVVQPDPREGLRTPIAIETNVGYVASLAITNGYIGGHAIGIPNGGAIAWVRLTDLTMQNAINFDMSGPPTREYTQVNVLHKPLGQHPPQYILLPADPAWTTTLPPDNIDAWLPQTGNHFTTTNWQGAGKDYRFFTTQQRAPIHAIYSDNDHQRACPEQQTVGQCWDTYGMAYRGDVVKDADAVTLAGVIGGVAALGTATTFGPPRSVITFPTLREPAIVEGDVIWIFGTLTAGDLNDPLRYSIDGGAPIDAIQSEFARAGSRRFPSRVITPGEHTIQTWRTTAAGATIPSSLLTFKYRVGNAPPPTTVTVPNVVGQMQAAATTAITALGLTVTVTTAPSPAPVGTVTSQVPVGGTQVQPGSAVALVVSAPVIPPPVGAPAGTYTYVCDAAGQCVLTFVKQP